MKIAKTYREFIKINRKYAKKNMIKRIDHINGKRFVSYWEYKDWVGYIIDDIYKFDSNAISYTKLMIGTELYNYKIDGIKFLLLNKGVDVVVKNETSGKFRGLILTNRDVYYLIDNMLIPIHFDWRIKS